MACTSSAASSKSLSPPLDLSHHYSRVTKNRLPSSIKAFYKYFTIPGIGNLAGGLPNPSYFPFDTLEGAVALPHRFAPTPNDPVDPPSASTSTKRNGAATDPTPTQVVVPHDSSSTNVLKKIDLATALEYGTAQGYPPLYGFIRQFVLHNLHPNVPYKNGPEIILTCGSTDGFAKCMEAFSNPWDEERDWLREREGLLCEEFAYGNALQAARPRGLNIVPVAIDDEGMCADGPGGLEEVLMSWDKSKGKRPHLMYTVTMGQNPTSGLLSLERRKKIYKLCSRYDILIIEDDPYWYLQYPSANEISIQTRGRPVSTSHPVNAQEHNYNAGKKGSGYKFLDTLVPSYLHVDTDGRVVRLDTFSKTVAPGCRLGWITAQPAFVEKILRISETSTQQPSGFVQSMLAEMIIGPEAVSDPGKGGSKDGSGWKTDGWVRWLEGLRGMYERRMQTMAKILDDGKYAISTANRRPSSSGSEMSFGSDDFEIISKTQMYDFPYPMAGMFLWMKVNYYTHPVYGKIANDRLSRAMWIYLTTEPFLCLVAPGTMFSASKRIMEEQGWKYFRLCFAAVDDDILAKHSHDLVAAFKSFWQKTKVSEIEDILKDDETAALYESKAIFEQQIFPRPFHMC